MTGNRGLLPARLCRTMTGMEPIAHIHTDLPQKFGIPRNSFWRPICRDASSLSRNLPPTQRLRAWTPSLIYGCSGALKTERPAARRRISPPMPRRRTGPAPTPSGRRPCVRRAWVEQSAWACLPRAVRFAPIPSVLPASNSIVSSLPTTALSSMCWGRPARRHAHLRYQALHSVCRLSPGRDRRLD